MDQVFVGRTAESELLDEGLAAARAGSGRLFLVTGEPGIGKSRLTGEFTDRARASGARVAWGRCWEAGGAPAYWPWTDALETIVAHLGAEQISEALGKGVSDLGQILPRFGPASSDVAFDPDTARFRLFDAVVRLCRAAARDAPLVVVLDDVHVADSSSLLLLRYVCGQLHESGVLVIATYRDQELSAGHPFTGVLEHLLRERSTRRVQLRGLGDVAVAQFIEMATGRSATDRLVRRLRRQTEGNPLYLSEIVRLLEGEGTLQ